ncbi:M15 family metallopeptidase [Saccharothrix variisporea]|uniref:D-alanyl-D-alanine dipeptidase n=1 Tax=Saccharothrix variisporea TaxID=543527 RepID=A0A495X7S0_9PSEU|nr:M15 family metallopeptidase [Saccharothrix variisporea]RKT69205.1 D-alanyl-D-alanine dipeptidase [Saccharothrix variisporea]
MPKILLISDERVAAIPVRDCGELLCDLRDIPALRAAVADVHVRTGVADRLVAAQTLLPRGVRLLVVAGYRSPAEQERLFAEHSVRLTTDHPEWTVDQVRTAASRHIAPPELAPHVAGAAVTLTLCTDDGAELPMGTAVDADLVANARALVTASTIISPEERANRSVLSGAMGAVELVNYPTLWWHWSYGDRYWAHVTGRPSARYGPVPPPGER